MPCEPKNLTRIVKIRLTGRLRAGQGERRRPLRRWWGARPFRGIPPKAGPPLAEKPAASGNGMMVPRDSSRGVGKLTHQALTNKANLPSLLAEIGQCYHAIDAS